MRAEDVVRSARNPLIVRVRSALAGREPGTLVLQGERLVADALSAGVALETVLVAEGDERRARELADQGAPVQLVEPELLARLGTLSSPPGALALAPAPPPCDLRALALGPKSLLLVAAGVSDPGNLGALARAAEAFGAAAFVALQGGASPWNEKALRGSMGSLLRVPVAAGAEPESLTKLLAERGVRSVRAATRGGADVAATKARGPIALWIGAESGALPDIAARFDALTIAMQPGAESLNVTVAASILLYELRRSLDGAR